MELTCDTTVQSRKRKLKDTRMEDSGLLQEQDRQPRQPRPQEEETKTWVSQVVEDLADAYRGVLRAPRAAPREWLEDTAQKVVLAAHRDHIEFPVINRIEFKLAAAKYFVDAMKAMRQDGWWKYTNFDLDVSLDCFFSELIGAVDAFLQLANLLFGLRLSESEVRLGSINERLKETRTKSKAVARLNRLASDHRTWYWQVNEYRNRLVHRRGLEKATALDPQRKMAEIYFYDMMEVQYDYRKAREREVTSYCDSVWTKAVTLLRSLCRLLENDLGNM